MKTERQKPYPENYRDKVAKSLLHLRNEKKSNEAREVMADIQHTQTYIEARAAYVYERDILSKLDDNFLASFDRFANQECYEFFYRVLKARRKYSNTTKKQPRAA